MNTKEKIFHVSLDLSSQKGYDSVSLREIADNVGIKKSSIYSHYPSKEAILMDIFEYLTNLIEYDELLNSEDLNLTANNDILLENPELFYHNGSEAIKKMFSQERNLKIWRLIFIQMHHNEAIKEFFQNEILVKPLVFWKEFFTILKEKGIDEVDGILMDLGVSSPQFDKGERGFSYKEDARLDMRMDQRQDLTAYNIINTYSLEDLTKIFQIYGEEKYSFSIAKNIIKARESAPIETTFQLVEIIKRSSSWNDHISCIIQYKRLF